MVVSTDVRLPAQPADGFAEYIPLGGDGFRTPFQLCNAYVQSTGDATGGNHFLTIRIDPVYTWVLDWIEIINNSALGNAATLTLNVSPRESGLFNQSQIFTLDDLQPALITPAPMILEIIDDSQVTAPRFSITAPNVDADELRMSIQMYAFDKRAREFGFTRDMFSVVTRGINTAASS